MVVWVPFVYGKQGDWWGLLLAGIQTELFVVTSQRFLLLHCKDVGAFAVLSWCTYRSTEHR